jgi:hypothetical protein
MGTRTLLAGIITALLLWGANAPDAIDQRVYTDFDSSGSGVLLQHDASRHCWVPGLDGYQYVPLQDDQSWLVVGATSVLQETS